MPGQRRKALEDGGAETSDSAKVFQLYQQGLAPEQMLQLSYMRRCAPRRLRTERWIVEDAMVLPRPALDVASVLAPVDFSLRELVEQSASSPISQRVTCVEISPAVDNAIARTKESARKHFRRPRQADPHEIYAWGALAEEDWIEIFKSTQDGDEGGKNGKLPEAADLCWLLGQSPSDAFVAFVWDHLLMPILKRCAEASGAIASPPPHQELFALLVAQRSFASLSPKDFRAKVRARSLRQVNDVFGAQAELLLVALYRRQREAGQKCRTT